MTWAPGDPLYPVVDGVTRPMVELLDGPTITPEVCTVLLQQIELDRWQPSWQGGSHAVTLDHAQEYVASLRDWLEGMEDPA